MLRINLHYLIGPIFYSNPPYFLLLFGYCYFNYIILSSRLAIMSHSFPLSFEVALSLFWPHRLIFKKLSSKYSFEHASSAKSDFFIIICIVIQLLTHVWFKSHNHKISIFIKISKALFGYFYFSQIYILSYSLNVNNLYTHYYKVWITCFDIFNIQFLIST